MFADRKSIRKYRPDEVSEELIREVIEAARVAPSAKNRQPWRFIVFTGNAKEEMLNAMELGINKQKSNPFMPKRFKQGLVSADNTLRIMREAPVTIIVMNTLSCDPLKSISHGKRISEIHNTLSVGAAIENMLLRATQLGLGSLWVGNTVYAHKELTSYLGTSEQIAGAVALGYANEIPEGRPKKTLDEIIEFRN